jgi:spore germination protein KA
MFGRTKENEKARGDQELSSEKLKQAFTDCPDIVFSDISVKGNKRLRLTLVYVEGLVDERMTDDFILKPLVQEEVFAQARSQQAVIDLIVHGAVYHNQRTLREKLDDCVDDILSGSVALIFDETRLAVTFELKGFEKGRLPSRQTKTS